MSRNLMIDIETLAGSVDAVVLQIGAVEFDPQDQSFGNELCLDLALVGQKDRKCDPRTVLWWASQGEAALDSVLRIPDSKRMPVDASLDILRDRISKSEYVWARGPSFDLAIINNLAAGRGIVQGDLIPFWKWRDERVARDLIESCGYGMMREGTHHNALDDARHQAKNVLRAYEIMQKRNKPL